MQALIPRTKTTAYRLAMATLRLRSFHREFRRPLSLVCLQNSNALSASRQKSSTSPRTGPSMYTRTSSPLLARSRSAPSRSRSSGRPIGCDTKMSGTDTWSGGPATNRTAIIRATGRITLSSTWCENIRCRSPKSRRKRRPAGRHPGPSWTGCGRLSMHATGKHPISPRRRSAASAEVRVRRGRSLRCIWHAIWRPSVFRSSTSSRMMPWFRSLGESDDTPLRTTRRRSDQHRRHSGSNSSSGSSK